MGDNATSNAINTPTKANASAGSAPAQSRRSTTIVNLPTEVVVAISHRLQRKDACSLGRTSKLYYTILREHIIYERLRLGNYRYNLIFGLGPRASRGYDAVSGLSCFERDVGMVEIFQVGGLLRDVTLGFDVTDEGKPLPYIIEEMLRLKDTIERFAFAAKNIRSATLYGTNKTLLLLSFLKGFGKHCKKLTDLSIHWTWKQMPPAIPIIANELPKGLRNLKVELKVEHGGAWWFGDDDKMPVGDIVEKMVSASQETLINLDIAIANAVAIKREGVRWLKIPIVKRRDPLPLKFLRYHLDIFYGEGVGFVIGYSVPSIYSHAEEIHLEQAFNGVRLYYDMKRDAAGKDPVSLIYGTFTANTIFELDTNPDGTTNNHHHGLDMYTWPDISSSFFGSLKGCKRLYLDIDAMDDPEYWEDPTIDHVSFMDCMEKAVFGRWLIMLRFGHIMPVIEHVVWPLRNEKLSVNLTLEVNRDKNGIVDFTSKCDCRELRHVFDDATDTYYSFVID